MVQELVADVSQPAQQSGPHLTVFMTAKREMGCLDAFVRLSLCGAGEQASQWP